MPLDMAVIFNSGEEIPRTMPPSNLCVILILLLSVRYNENENSALELYFRVFDCLSPLDIIAASHASKIWYNASQRYFGNALWRLLLRFFNRREAEELRVLQAELGVVISGSSAIQFFQRMFIEDSDLDIYVEHSHALRLGCFLERIAYHLISKETEENQGDSEPTIFTPDMALVASESSFEDAYYSHDPSINSRSRRRRFHSIRRPDYELFGIADVFTFQRGGKVVQIIASRGPVLQLILSFHSTVPMNFITHSHAYSLYPKATLKEKRGLIITCSGHNQDAAREKYRQRGWYLLDSESGLTMNEITHPDEFEFGCGRRWVGDSKCMTVALPPLELSESMPTTPWTSNSWTLEFNSNAVIKCSIFVGQRWKHCVADKDLMEIMEMPSIVKLADRFRCSTDIVFEIIAARYRAQQLRRSQEGLISFFEQSDVYTNLLTDLLDRTR